MDQPATVQVADASSPHPESTQHAVPSMDNDAHTEEKCLEAAKFAAEALAQKGEQGFDHLLHGPRPPGTVCRSSIHWNALVRLAFCADHTLIDPKTRQLASHCGGVPPDPERKLLPCQGTDFVADPGNKVYFNVVRKLLEECVALRATAPKSLDDQIKYLEWMGMGCRGDCIEAALAAADHAEKRENGKPITYKDMVGGSHATGDLPT